MPLVPIPRRARSSHGPRTTCLRASPLARTKCHNWSVKTRWSHGLLHLCCAWAAACSAWARALLLLGLLDFRLPCELLFYGGHATLLLLGGLGRCFMVFVDM